MGIQNDFNIFIYLPKLGFTFNKIKSANMLPRNVKKAPIIKIPIITEKFLLSAD